jgi:hypothetical protein
VEHGIAKHDVGDSIRKGHLLDEPDLKVLRWQSGGERGRELTHVVNGLWIGIERKHLTAFAKQVDEIPPIAASGVEHDHAGGNVPAQDLIEDVNIDLAELFLNG